MWKKTSMWKNLKFLKIYEKTGISKIGKIHSLRKIASFSVFFYSFISFGEGAKQLMFLNIRQHMYVFMFYVLAGPANHLF